jgi:hypothetical protein
MAQKRLKINLELHQVGEGRTFLNYWNARNGDDVACEVVDGRLIHEGTEITLAEFIDKVVSKF